MNDIHKNFTLYINVRKPMKKSMKKRTNFSIFSCFITMSFVTLIVTILASATIVLQLQELQTQFKCISTTTEHETSLLTNLNNYELITSSDTFAKRLQRLKRDNKEQQNEEKGETSRQSEEESEKQQQSKEEDKKQRRNKEKEETWRENEEETEEKQSKRKSKIQRQYEKKGEKRQNRRGHKHKRRRSRPLVATFVGAIPEQLTNTAYIGPWIKSKNEYHKYDLTKFHLVEDNMSIQVDTSGLYMISVQVYYFGHSMNYTYWLLLNSEGSSIKQKLITCTTSGNEVSCYTSVVIHLHKGDRLSLQQQEKNRLINLRQGYSQIQIMMLANDKKFST